MWTNRQLKLQARHLLSHFYWLGFCACLIVFGLEIIAETETYLEILTLSLEATETFVHIPFHIAVPLFMHSLVFTVVAHVIKFFVLNPLIIGEKRYFMENDGKRAKFSDTFFPFKSRYYFNMILTMFLKWASIFLGFICLVAPGIMLFYSFKMVPYILAQNPSLSPIQVLKLSFAMTRGHKFHMFLLDLSFSGWFLLCILTLGIGFLFLNPYYYASYDELYFFLSKKAIDEDGSLKDVFAVARSAQN